MTRRYVLAPEAAIDLLQIWRYTKRRSGVATADRVEHAILDKMVFLAGSPGAGHLRENLTDEAVKFFPVYSYLIVYRPGTKPLQIVAILHGKRDVERILKDRTRNSGDER
jgi:toxin ParE1/3/4